MPKKMPDINAANPSVSAETGRLVSAPISTHEISMNLAKESEIHKIFEVALHEGKIDTIDKLLVLFQVENPLATDKDCSKFLRMSIATVKKRQLNPAVSRLKSLIEGTFAELAGRARYIGLKRISHIMETGGNKSAIDAYKALEMAAANSEAARAAMGQAGIRVGIMPTTEQALKILREDPAEDNSEVEIEPLD